MAFIAVSTISRTGINEIESENGQKTTEYAIWTGESKHRFDSILMEKDETNWILGELLDFLSQTQ